MNEGNKFIKGALILTLAGAFVKVLGAVYRIPLYSILGPEGIGLFQAAYPVYAMMLSISTAGVPVAVSKLVAEKLVRSNYIGAKQVFRVSLMLMVGSGLLMTGILLLGARYYVENFLQTPAVYYPLIAIAPSIIFFAVKSAYRGYFQGQQTMVPTAISQIAEQIVRVVTIFILASVLVNQSLELGAAGAALGTVTGAAAGLLVLMIVHLRRKKVEHASHGQNKLSKTTTVMREILTLALPITLGSVVLPLVNMVDSTIILPRLQAGGFSRAEALEMFGNFQGGAMPLINLPTIFTIALATSLVPAISNANALRNNRMVARLAGLTTRIGLMIGLPAAVGLHLLANPISIMLYDNVDVARPLAWVSFAIIFISLNQTTAPVLQGLGKTYLPVTNLFVGLVIKVIMNFFLTAIPEVNILGPVAGTITAFAVAGMLNLRSISRQVGPVISVKDSIAKPLINTLVMALVVGLTYPIAADFIQDFIASERLLAAAGVMVSMTAGVAVYGLSTLFTGTITKAELELVPKLGPKLARILSKLRLLRS